jgi:hypothetical protein
VQASCASMDHDEDEGGDDMIVEDDEDMVIGGEEDVVEVADEAAAGAPMVWDPSKHPLEEDEELDYDRSAYKAMHELGVEWPSLSFDIVGDSLGFMRKVLTRSLLCSVSHLLATRETHTLHRKTWPQTMLMVAGSQAADPR